METEELATKLLIDRLEQYKNPSLKTDCLSFIKDKTINLNLRWSVYISMPTDFLKRESYILHFDVEKFLPTKEISWYDDFYIERNETVVMVDIIETLYDRVRNPENYDADQIWSSELIDDFKEEILQRELSCFRMDW